MGLRLARFNAMLDVDKPKWQSNYFTRHAGAGRCRHRAAAAVLNGLGFFDVRAFPLLIALYTLCMAFLLVSTIPTFSGKLLGERIERELVLPILIGVAALVALLVTYPYGTLTVVTLLYLAAIPAQLPPLPARTSGSGRRAPASRSSRRTVADQHRRDADLHPETRHRRHGSSRRTGSWHAYRVSSGAR